MIKLKVDGRIAKHRDTPASGRIHKISVHVMTLPMSMKEQGLIAAAVEFPVDDAHVQIVRTVFYPSLIACSTGDLPTEEEFLALPSKVVNEWYEALLELNPDIHEFDDGSTEKEKLKKNGK